MNAAVQSIPARTSGSGLVLIANDHEWTARSLETVLVAAGLKVVRTFTGHETLAVASAQMPDLLILDHQLPDISGIAVCSALRADPRFGPSTPILITTAGPSGRQQRLAAYEAGAWEFFGQPLDGEALLPKVKVFLAARQAAVALGQGVLIDSETGLYTRAGLERRAAELMGEARRSGGTFTCVSIAASPSHNALADKIVSTLRVQARSSDVTGRLGPHAFAVLAAGLDTDGAQRLADRLRSAVDDGVKPGESGLRIAIASSGDPSTSPVDPRSFLAQAALDVAA